MALQMAVEKLDEATAVGRVSGSLTMGTNLKTIDSNLQTLIAGGARRVVLDLSDCPYSDSSGLGLLLHTFGLLEESGGALRLCGVTPRVQALLARTHTDKILAVDADRAASLAALGA